MNCTFLLTGGMIYLTLDISSFMVSIVYISVSVFADFNIQCNKKSSGIKSGHRVSYSISSLFN